MIAMLGKMQPSTSYRKSKQLSGIKRIRSRHPPSPASLFPDQSSTSVLHLLADFPELGSLCSGEWSAGQDETAYLPICTAAEAAASTARDSSWSALSTTVSWTMHQSSATAHDFMLSEQEACCRMWSHSNLVKGHDSI